MRKLPGLCIASTLALFAAAGCGKEPIEGTGGASGSASGASGATASTAGASGTETGNGTCDPPCDDGIACTADLCVNGSCVYEPDDGACMPGFVCDANKGGCAGGSCDDCQPLNECDQAACVDGQCVHNESCGPDLVCCDGTCVPPGCDDGDPCTDDSCGGPGKGCIHEPNTGAPCDDGNPCTEGDVCNAGVCTSGSPVTCDDGNPCTVDSCDPQAGCVAQVLPDGTACDDGDACTQGEQCTAGTCDGGAPVACTDGNPCTQDLCNPQSGCVFPPADGVACDDGNACTVGDTCVGGACQGGNPLDCDDGNPCTDDTCAPQTGCVYAEKDGASCDDGDACTVGDTCFGDTCTGTMTLDCDDEDVCTVDLCDPQTGCAHIPLDCDDNDPCTIDSCNSGVGCINVPDPNC